MKFNIWQHQIAQDSFIIKSTEEKENPYMSGYGYYGTEIDSVDEAIKMASDYLNEPNCKYSSVIIHYPVVEEDKIADYKAVQYKLKRNWRG